MLESSGMKNEVRVKAGEKLSEPRLVTYIGKMGVEFCLRATL